MSMGIFTLTLAANESREVAISGEYFELRNALSPIVLIELLDRSGGVIARLDNPEQSDFVRPGRYETIRITNGATAQTIKHFYGSGDAGSRRTSGTVTVLGTVGVTGNVAIVDSEKSRTLLGVVFEGNPAIGGVAAEYSRVQLFNPVGSGKNLIVTEVLLTTNVSAGYTLYANSASLLTNVTATRTGSKKMGGALGVATAFVETGAAVGVKSFGTLSSLVTTAGVPIVLAPKMPYIVPPGFGMVAETSGVNITLNMDVSWFEEAI